MKFVALALTLLLAVGSQAASLQADAPSQLAHARAAMDVYLTQVKESANRALDQLDGTEYANLKTSLIGRLDDMYNQIKALQSAISPITDNVVNTLVDTTADARSTIMADLEAITKQTDDNFQNVKNVIKKHLEEYRSLVEPTLNDFITRHTAEMEALGPKLQPVMEELQGKVSTNVEETKTALMPIVEAVRAKLTERAEDVRRMVTPYVDEYKEQLKTAINQAQNINTDDFDALRQKITPLADDIKTKFQTIFELIAAAATKQ